MQFLVLKICKSGLDILRKWRFYKDKRFKFQRNPCFLDIAVNVMKILFHLIKKGKPQTNSYFLMAAAIKREEGGLVQSRPLRKKKISFFWRKVPTAIEIEG